MNLIEHSIRRPVGVTAVVLLVLIFGLLGVLGVYDFLRLPVQLTPNVDQPVITVTTRWFGASPQEIEQEIVQEQEDVLKTVRGLREMTSQCIEGEGTIELRFFVGVDRDAALNEVRDKLRQVPQYPIDVDEPVVQAVTAGADSPIAWMLLRPIGGDVKNFLAADPAKAAIAGYVGDVTQLQDYLEDEVRPILERVTGVAEVNVLGGRQREMQVRVDIQKLAARGISITQFTQALRNENVNVTAGTLPEGKRDTSVRAVGQYEDPEQIRNTVVAYTSAGAPVYVRDVADVQLGFKKETGFVRARGQEVVALNAKRETGTNVLTVMAGLKQAIKKINSDVLLPRGLGLELHQVYDESLYVTQSMQTARTDLFMGAILAAGVLFLTLRSVGATSVIAVSVPISVIGTLLGMALTGRNLNVISMAGLTFSVGIGIDNAIVVLENIFRHREMGKDRVRAALDGTSEVWGAIVASIATNVAVFVPMLFIQEEAGQLFRDIAVAISISMLLYLIVSPTVIPMLAALLMRRMPQAPRGADRPQTRLGRATAPAARFGNAVADAFQRIVYWLTGGFLRRVTLVTVMVAAAIFLSWALIPPRTYLPSGNQNFVFSMLSPPPGYNTEEYRRMAHFVESRMRPWWEATLGSPELAKLQADYQQNLHQVVIPRMEEQLKQMKATMPPEQFAKESPQMRGRIEAMRNAPPPPPIDNFFFVARPGALFMGARSAQTENVKPLATLLQDALQGIPGTFGFATQVPIFRLGRTSGSTIEVNVTGTDYTAVRAGAGVLQGAMTGRFGTWTTASPTNFNVGRPEVRVVADKVRGASAGVTTEAIRQLSQVAVDGLILGDYRQTGRTIDLTVVARDSRAQTPADLRDVPVVTNDGRVIPLASVTNLVETSAAQQINRLERLPAVTLSVQLPAGMTIQEARQIVEQEIVAPLREQGVLPAGVSTVLTGSADKLEQFMKAFIPGFILAAVVTYLLLAVLFESFLYPLVIIMSVPFALVGGFIGLALLHAVVPDALLDVLTMLGFVILIGIIVNNPILIVHQALNYIRAGMERNEAIALSTRTRVRPIFMSVSTTVAATAPLVVMGGAGSEMYRGLGSVIIGGLLLSTLFTLILTPSLMSLMLDAQHWLAGFVRWRRTAGKKAPAPMVEEPASPVGAPQSVPT